MASTGVVLTQPLREVDSRTFNQLFLSRPHTLPNAMEPIRLLGIPYGLDETAVPGGAMQVSRRERPDAIVLTDLNSAQLIAGRLPAGLAAILPVVDASRRQSHGGRANR